MSSYILPRVDHSGNYNHSKDIQMTNQSKLLSSFYDAMYQWIAEDCPTNTESTDKPPFTIAVGLCTNLTNFCNFLNLEFKMCDLLHYEMRTQFKDAGLNAMYPFNESIRAYMPESDEDRYTNPARIAWIIEHTTLENQNI